MPVTAPLATVPIAFFDQRTGLSALAVQHLRTDGRLALVYHDAPSSAAALPLLGALAEALVGEIGEGRCLGIIESSLPEHPAERFAYAQVILSTGPLPGRVRVGAGRQLGLCSVAEACGVEAQEVARTEELVRAVHRPRACAFPGFRQLRRLRVDEAVARVGAFARVDAAA